MIVYTLEQRWEVGLRSTYRRCRFWQKKSSFQIKLNLILAGMQTIKIVGPIFCENEQVQPVTVNADRYRAMLNEYLFRKIEEENIGNIWF